MTPLGRSDDEILRAMNHALAEVPVGVGDTGTDHPIVFICGAPRSGTTLLYQLLTYVGDVGYVNNLVARFYANAPLGAWLSEQAQIPKVFRPVSEYGRTEGVSSPHEFGRFWLDAFGLDRMGEPDTRPDDARITEAARRVARLAGVFDRPFVAKSFDYLWFIGELARDLPGSRWVHITRDRGANISSLVALYERRADGGPPPTWTSATLRATRAAHGDDPLEARVTAQVDDLNAHITRLLGQLPTHRRAALTLEQLTADPVETVGALLDTFGIAHSRERLSEAAEILARTPADD